ncbi:MAG TPA: hypothetical protein VGR08_05660 [Thermomicrobiales bacterium]|nr:hypothetical protein [Thermomicrobiales bacterium]
MIFRVLYLIALIGVVGRDPGSGDSRVVRVERIEEDQPERRMGGEGFGNIVSLVVLIGVVVLAAILILAVLAFTGQFEKELIDPPA